MKTQFYFVDKALVVDFVWSNVHKVVGFLWFLIWRYIFPALESIFRFLFRLDGTKSSSLDFVDHPEKDHQVGLDSYIDEFNEEKERALINSSTSKYEFLSGEGISGFLEEPKTMSFTIHDVFGGLVDDGVVNMASIVDSQESKFETGEKTEESCNFGIETGKKAEEANKSKLVSMDKTEEACKSEIEAGEKTEEAAEVPTSLVVNDIVRIGVKGFHQEDLILHDDGCNPDEDFEIKEKGHGKAEDSVFSSLVEGVLEKPAPRKFTNEERYFKERFNPGFEASSIDDFQESGLKTEDYETEEADLCDKRKRNEEEAVDGLETLCDNDFDQDEMEESVGSNDYCSRTSDKIDSTPNSNLNDGFQPESHSFSGDDEIGDCNKESVFSMHDFTDSDDDEYIEFAPQNQYSISSDDEIWSEENLRKIEEKYGDHNQVHEEAEQKTEHLDKSQAEALQEKGPASNYNVEHDDLDSDSDFVFDHQDIIEQLKMELKNARTGGLPTIQEESENEESSRTPPLMVQELRPLKIEDKFVYKDCIDEIQKVYKSYSDKMRKLDILNYQTMHALGLHQMRDSFQSQTSWKFSLPTMKRLLFHNFFSCKQIANVMDPSKKITADMKKDFELVYVGQLCLSWEILHWQFQKAQELQTHERQDSYSYNQVAVEFQLFQVLLHRFIENEAFQGPRVQNYVQSRSVLRNLLQVPAIKDDNSKDKGKRDDGEDAITIQMLTSIVEESMHLFWEFFRSDKDDNVVYHHQAPISLMAHVDLELLTDVRNHLQKKEKKLKDIMRSGNCMVKRFQNQQEGRDLLLMVARVELKLVRSVLNMSKVTKDQVLWCLDKLDKIKFSNRRILIEPSFLLFPC